jgi:hypothetical protein
VTGGGTDRLTLDDSGSTADATGALSPTAVTGLGMAAAGVSYSGLAGLDVRLGGGTNTLAVANTAAGTATAIAGGIGRDAVTLQAVGSPTTVSTAGGDDTVNVRATNAATTVDVGTGADVVNVGSAAPAGNGSLDGVQAAVGVTGSNAAVLNVDDAGNPAAKTGTLTPTRSPASRPPPSPTPGVGAVNVTLGLRGRRADGHEHARQRDDEHQHRPGDDTVNVRGTAGPTNLATGPGANTVVVGSAAPTIGTGVLADVAGPLSITGGGTDALTLDDAADALPRTATLTATKLAGVAPADVAFAGVAALTLNLGTANDALTVAGTIAGTTTVNAGPGSDAVHLHAVAGPTAVNAGTGDDTVNLRAASAAATIDTGTGTNTVNVGSAAPATGTGVVDAIAAAGPRGRQRD